MRAIDVNDALSMRRISLMIHVSQLCGDVATAKNIGGNKRVNDTRWLQSIHRKVLNLSSVTYTQQFNYNT